MRNQDVSPCGCSIASRSEGWELRSLVGWFKQSWNKAGAGVSLSHRRWQNWSVWGLGEPRAHDGKTCSRALIPGYRKRCKPCRFHWPHGHLQPAQPEGQLGVFSKPVLLPISISLGNETETSRWHLRAGWLWGPPVLYGLEKKEFSEGQSNK